MYASAAAALRPACRRTDTGSWPRAQAYNGGVLEAGAVSGLGGMGAQWRPDLNAAMPTALPGL